MFFVPLQLKWRSERARIQRNATAQKRSSHHLVHRRKYSRREGYGPKGTRVAPAGQRSGHRKA